MSSHSFTCFDCDYGEAKECATCKNKVDNMVGIKFVRCRCHHELCSVCLSSRYNKVHITNHTMENKLNKKEDPMESEESYICELCHKNIKNSKSVTTACPYEFENAHLWCFPCYNIHKEHILSPGKPCSGCWVYLTYSQTSPIKKEEKESTQTIPIKKEEKETTRKSYGFNIDRPEKIIPNLNYGKPMIRLSNKETKKIKNNSISFDIEPSTIPIQKKIKIISPIEFLDGNKKRMEKFMLEKMCYELKGKVHNPEEFCKWMKKYGAVMTGSFPLQVLLDEQWCGKNTGEKVGDIDILVMGVKEDVKLINPMVLQTKLMNLIFDCDFTNTKNLSESITKKDVVDKFGDCFGHIEDVVTTKYNINNFSKFGCCLKFVNKVGQYSGIGEVGDVEAKYENLDILRIVELFYSENNNNNSENKTKIQIIHINPDKYPTIKSFVKEFDLDFCKIMFDGETFNIFYPDAILEKKSIYRNPEKYKNKDIRIKKYQDRGFTIL